MSTKRPSIAAAAGVSEDVLFEVVVCAAVVVRDHAIANGMMLRATGDTMILSPPLIWTRETIDMACERIARALDLAEADLVRAG